MTGDKITRRAAMGAFGAAALSPSLFADPTSKMGIASTSFSSPINPSAVPEGRLRGRDTYEYLEKCHALGAAGIQTRINGDIPRLRARAEELGMWVEGMVTIPRNGDAAAFEKSLQNAKAAGATVVRMAALAGRRYETFPTLADWNRWLDQTHTALRLAVSSAEKQKITIALENHKDWTLEDMEKLLKTYSNEYLGVLFDFGNNVSLLDDPMEMVQVLAPYAKSTHVKDMGVRPYEDGFLLSEVLLGTGLLDLPTMIAALRKANPNIRFTLEMITRDPLKVPCMTEKYWTVFPNRNGKYLARTFKLVQKNSSPEPLPTVSQLSHEGRLRLEDENVTACLKYGREKLGL